MALVLWGLGYADQAQQWNQEALALASQVGHTPTLGFAHFYAARLAHCRRDVTATQAHAEALMAFAAEQDLPSAWSRDGSCEAGHWPCRATPPRA